MKTPRAIWWSRVLLIVGITCCYVIPFPDWRFWGDDYGCFDAAQINSVRDVTSYFGAMPNHRIVYPSNTRDTTAWTFGSVSFRPLTLMMYAAESWLFGGKPSQAFFLVFMLLFALTALLFLQWLSKFLSVSLALVGTIFFVCHTSLGGWLGVWGSQTYLLLFIGMSGIIWLVQRFFERRNWWTIVLAALLFFVLLLFHEQVAIVPVWLLPLFILHIAYHTQRRWYDQAVIREAVALTVPFFCSLLLYLLWRWWCYPICHQAMVVTVKTVPFSARFLDLVTYVVELLGLAWMPSGIRLIKGSIIIGFFLYMAGLFWFSEEKGFLAALAWSVLCWSWPSILVRHQCRFLFLAAPFLILYMLCGIAPLLLHQSWYRRLYGIFGLLLLIVLSLFGVQYNYASMKARSEKAMLTSVALQQLACDPGLQGKSICFVGIPRDWFPGEGIAQAVWLYRGSRELPVFHEDQLCVYCFQSMGIKESINLPRYPLVDVAIVDNVVNLHSRDHEHAWFFALDEHMLSWPCSMGQLWRCEPGLKAYDITVVLDRTWLRRDLAFVTWNFKTGRFERYQSLQGPFNG